MSLEWLLERIEMRHEEIDKIRHDGQVEEHQKNRMIQAKRMESIDEVLEEVEVLIKIHFFDEFTEKVLHVSEVCSCEPKCD